MTSKLKFSVFSLVFSLVALGFVLLLGSCTPTYDLRIHRANGNVEKIETWREYGPSAYMVCAETKPPKAVSHLTCHEIETR